MCLVVFALGTARHFSLLLAANRDERHARPTRPASWWPDRPQVFGGRDLVAQGTWLAVDRTGRIAAVTNVRDGNPGPALRSRGALVSEYLTGTATIDGYLADVRSRAAHYGPFSLLLFERSDVRYVSNRGEDVALGEGVHALSNEPLPGEWPKTATARAGMERWLEHASPTEGLFALLAERSTRASAEERYRAAHFIDGPVYGTRCSTVITLDRRGTLTFVERSFDAAARMTGEIRETILLTPPASLRSLVRPSG
jgi:uncharacterized protein with NRDE domain